MDINEFIITLTVQFLLWEFSLVNTKPRVIVPSKPPDISAIAEWPIFERLNSRKSSSNQIIKQSVRAPKLPQKEKQREKYYFENNPLKRRPTLCLKPNKSQCFRFKDGPHRQYSEKLCELKKASAPVRSNSRNQYPTSGPFVNDYIGNLVYSYNPNIYEGYDTNRPSPVGHPSIGDNVKSNLSRLLLNFHKKEADNENDPNYDFRFKNVDLTNRQPKLKSKRLLKDREMSTTDFKITYSPSLEIHDVPESSLPEFNLQKSGKFAEPPPADLKINSTTHPSDNQQGALSWQLSKNYQRNYLYPLNQSSTMNYLQYPKFISNDTNSTHPGKFPLDLNHQQTSYTSAKSSYEVPVYENVPLDSSNSEVENYSNFFYDQSTATKASSDQIEPFEIVPCHYTKIEETGNIERRQNYVHHITDFLVHILDTPELKEAFEAYEKKKIVSSG